MFFPIPVFPVDTVLEDIIAEEGFYEAPQYYCFI
jgi:hypothetical protein